MPEIADNAHIPLYCLAHDQLKDLGARPCVTLNHLDIEGDLLFVQPTAHGVCTRIYKKHAFTRSADGCRFKKLSRHRNVGAHDRPCRNLVAGICGNIREWRADVMHMRDTRVQIGQDLPLHISRFDAAVITTAPSSIKMSMDVDQSGQNGQSTTVNYPSIARHLEASTRANGMTTCRTALPTAAETGLPPNVLK